MAIYRLKKCLLAVKCPKCCAKNHGFWKSRNKYIIEIHYLYDMDFSSFFHSSAKNSLTLRGFVIIIKIPLPCSYIPSWHGFYQFLCPGSRNPVFFPVVRFFKKYIFGIYIKWGTSRRKKFPRQISSGIRFCPKLIDFWHFS